MPPYTIENTLTRRHFSQAVVPPISTHGGIAGSGFYHFLPAHNRPNSPVSFKRTKTIRDPQQGAYVICASLRHSTQLDLNLIEWEHQYVKLNNALSTSFFRFRYLRSRIHKGNINNAVIIWFHFIFPCKNAIHKKGKERKRELAGKRWCEEGKCEWLAYSQPIYIDICICFLIYVAPSLGPMKNIGFTSNGRKKYLISCLLQHKVIPQPLGNSGKSGKTNEAGIAQKNRLFSSSQPTAQISIPVSENMTPSEIRRLVGVNQIKCIHFGRVAIFPSTILLISLVEIRPFTTMSEVEVNQWDELSQFLFLKKRFTDPIATNGALLEGFMFPIDWRKCSTKNEQFGLYGSLEKIENIKDEWWSRGANLSLVGCILVSYEDNIPANQGAFEFASAITFTMNGFKNAPHVDRDASLYASEMVVSS
ncbi:hypothetical protein O181_056024 [Austropuccinia psidii MF-1]|uniref:Tet-like 2OG-Fe(II) oxygenase domain-containing protein n=1 Tax=Austropuccinia psidii MF-1 TaxID=1389203 RepID=A0A9Q3HV83_9BASI|nr:hypothetical protein [Austropuccinia psidii MF-1]